MDAINVYFELSNSRFYCYDWPIVSGRIVVWLNGVGPTDVLGLAKQIKINPK